MPKLPPQASIETVPAGRVQAIVTDLLQLHDMGVCKDDDEVEARIDAYFRLCQASSIRPGIESLSAALHIDRSGLWRWSKGNGCSKRRQEAVNMAKGFIAAYLEQASLQGQVNPVTGIFLMKNWLGYKDTQTVEDARANSTRPNMTPSEILEQIEKDIPLDDVETAEVLDFRN